MLSTVLLVLAGLSLAGALDCGTTKNYDTSFYYCIQGLLCPQASPCLCPGTGNGCFTTADKDKCTLASPKGSPPPICYGMTAGDPLVKGFDGCAWYLQGKPDTVVNLVSETNHVVNSQLVSANLIDEHHGGEGTFHGAVSVRFQDVVVVTSVDAQGNLTVSMGEKTVPFDTIREQSGLTAKVTQHYPYYGQVAEIVTPAFRFFFQAVQPHDTPAGWSRGHLDFSTTATGADLAMHGLLGQTINSSGALCSEDFSFHGQGKEADYQMSDLQSVDFMYSMFATQKVQRRLQTTTVVYKTAETTSSASSEGLFLA